MSISTASSSSTAQQPTSRSRTLLFISYRDSRARTQDNRFSRHYDDPNAETEGLIAGASHVVLDVQDTLPPKWVDISDQVYDILANTQSKIAVLEKLHAKHALPGFSDRTAEEREIQSATTDITKDFRRCQGLIKRIGSESGQQHAFPPKQGSTRNEDLAAKNVQRALAARVQELSALFRKKQRIYMEKLQGHAIKNQDLLIASGTISSRGTEGMSAVDDDMQAATSGYQSQTQVQNSSSVQLRERDKELQHIAQSIAELAELFKDLSTLVIDQGTLLDSVEYNIEQTSVQMKEAVKELNVATQYQKNTGRRACIFLLVLIIFGLIVVLIMKPRRNGTVAPPPPPPPALAV